MKKRVLIAMLAALFLAGCGKTETMETVADEMDVPVLAQPRKISVELPGQAEAALETDAGQLYVTDDYEIAVETLDGHGVLPGAALPQADPVARRAGFMCR